MCLLLQLHSGHGIFNDSVAKMLPPLASKRELKKNGPFRANRIMLLSNFKSFVNNKLNPTLDYRVEPRYQEMLSKDIAEASEDGIKVRVIAGESLGVKSPIYTRTPTMYLDFILKPGAHLQQPIPAPWNAFVYVLEGEGVFGNAKSSLVSPHHLLLLGHGDGLEAWNKSCKPLRFILVGGEPLGEPMVQLGPFVMNTQEEIDQTIDDFENCTNGFEKARHWRSEAAIHLDH